MRYEIRTMTRSDFGLVMDWADAEGWNPGKHDLDSFLATDPNGFFVGLLDGQPIASLSAVAYDDRYGFIGFYIVKPDFRGQGYGRQIWQHGMRYLGDRTIGLDGIVGQQHNYRKSGFEIATANVRYAGIAARASIHALPLSPLLLVDAASIAFPQLAAFDRAYHPAPRRTFLTRWMQQAETTALAAISPDGDMFGYGAIRPGVQAWRVGPLFAETPDAARMLFGALAAKVGGEPICIDVPEANSAAAPLARAFGLEPVFPTARMYRRTAPEIDFAGIYGLTSLELG